MSSAIELVRGDIVELAVDAIVNAANSDLAPGGGVCGAIHRAAGPELAAECAGVGGCPTGEARITGGYRLAARHVIHAVGPVYHDGTHREAELLRSAYVSSLRLAAEHGLESLAFPAISTGIYGYPKREAAGIALAAVIDFLAGHAHPRRVVFVLFDETDLALYETVRRERGA
jgi:O-acetyl-ADP-ribose deacetylase (regulator of RNase III)